MKCWAEDFALLFMCPCTWFAVFGPIFPKLFQYHSTCETSITHPTEGLDTRLRSYLMSNKDLKSLDYFFCLPAHGFGVFRPSFPKLPQYPSTWEIGIAQPKEHPDTRVNSHFMFGKEQKTLDYFSCVRAYDLWYLSPVSKKCLNTWVPVKQV